METRNIELEDPKQDLEIDELELLNSMCTNAQKEFILVLQNCRDEIKKTNKILSQEVWEEGLELLIKMRNIN